MNKFHLKLLKDHKRNTSMLHKNVFWQHRKTSTSMFDHEVIMLNCLDSAVTCMI